MNIGNWTVSNTGIDWAGDSTHNFSIGSKELLEVVTLEEGMPEMYKWILVATDQDWLTEDDLYDFNHAFLYAIGGSDLSFDYETFDHTLIYQYELLDNEIDQEPFTALLSTRAEESAGADQSRTNAFSERD